MKNILIVFVMFVMFVGQSIAAVDINSATQAELETLQGIGPAKARAIIEYREENGSFSSIEGLVAVDGIGPGTMKQLGDSITVGNPVASDADATVAASKQ